MNVVNKQMEMLRAYRDRQDRIVHGLNVIAKALDHGSIDGAREAMLELLRSDLKQSQARVANWTLAIRLASDELLKDNLEDSMVIYNQVRALAPEAFEDIPVAVGRA